VRKRVREKRMQNQAGNVCSSIYGKEMITIGLGGGYQREVGRIDRSPGGTLKADYFYALIVI
jgi:hypothetical protein